MTNENFFKHDDKAYAENLNDAILIANAFDYQVPVNIPGMYGNNHYPNDNNIHKVGVADVTIVSSSSLSIGDTSITNNSNTSQVLRLRVYPNFNNFYGWKDLGWDGDDGITIDICDAGTTTSLLPSGELTNPDGNNLAGIASLRGLKEYDLLITIPVNGVLNTLSLVFVNNWNSQNRVSASINQSNVTGLESDLSGIRDDLSDLQEGKADTEHTHSSSDVTESNALSNIGTSANASQSVVNGAVDEKVGSLDTSISNWINFYNYDGVELWTNKALKLSYLQFNKTVSIGASSTTTMKSDFSTTDEKIPYCPPTSTYCPTNKKDVYLTVNYLGGIKIINNGSALSNQTLQGMMVFKAKG